MRREEVLRNHWFFSQEVGKEEALAPDFHRENWQAIQVPHDWSIYNDFDQYSPAQNEGGQLNGGSKPGIGRSSTWKKMPVLFRCVYSLMGFT